jgi:hypothetical protein
MGRPGFQEAGDTIGLAVAATPYPRFRNTASST